jgi:Capsule polysaccharide biosynthesis protein
MDSYDLNRLLRRARLYAPLHRLVHGARAALGRGAGDAMSPELVARLERTLVGLPEAAQRADRRVLVSGWSNMAAAAQQIPIIAAFVRAGFAPVVALESRATASRKLYEAAGAHDLAFWNELQPARTRASQLSPLKSEDDLKDLHYDGLRMGRYALSTMMRSTRCGRFDLSDAKTKATAFEWLQKTLDGAAFADQLIAQCKPDALLVTDQGYTPLGPLFERCINAGTPAFSWNAAHRDNLVVMKRYQRDNIDSHPFSLSAASWETVRRRPWTAADWDQLATELAHSYRSGQWYGEVGTQFHKVFPSRDELVRRLALDPARPTVLVFPHIFWDGTFFWGHDLFPNYEAFFAETLKVAYATPQANWIVKIHPANLVKNRRDGFAGRSNEMQVIEAMGALPSHVKVLDATTDISTLSLYEIGDVCVTVRGTVGMEAACFGLTTVTAGTGRYDRLGFTTDPDTPDEFRDLLRHVERLKKPTTDAVELARRYTRAVLLERPVTYRTIEFGYAHDAVASLTVSVREGAGALIDSPDVEAMAAFIRSDEEDFLAAP